MLNVTGGAQTTQLHTVKSVLSGHPGDQKLVAM
jgi:hypothetical protein